MPRNNAGSYSLPSGTPYVTGTTISSSIVNNVNSDVATELTNSLDRNGRGQMLAPLPLADGSVTAPALTFNAETGTGFFRAGTNDVRLAIGGNSVLQATAAGAFVLVGLNVTSTITNAAALAVTGNGTGAGVVSTGGSGGAVGVSGIGTIGYTGVQGTGGPSNGIGVNGTGSGSGAGVLGNGTGTGPGVVGNGSGTSPGVQGTASSSGTGGTFSGGPTSGTGVVATGGGTAGTGIVATGTANGSAGVFTGGGAGAAAVLVTGDQTGAKYGLRVVGNTSQSLTTAALSVVGTVAAGTLVPVSPVTDGTAAYKNTVTPDNIPKVLCTATLSGITPYFTTHYRFNVSNITVSNGTSAGSTLNVTFAQSMADTNYVAAISLFHSQPTFYTITSKNPGSCSIALWGSDGAPLTFSASAGIQIMLSVFGAQ